MENELVCPYCGQTHPSTAQFCPKTGQKIPAKQLCQNCGGEVQSSWRMCAFCGQKLSTDNGSATAVAKRQGKRGVGIILACGTIAFLLVGVAIVMWFLYPDSIGAMFEPLRAHLPLPSPTLTPTSTAEPVVETDTPIMPEPTPTLTTTPELSGLPKWHNQNSGTNNILSEIFFTDMDYGWAVIGESDTGILHSSDGGNTWVEQNSPTQLSLESVSFVDRNVGFVSGGNCYMDQTSQGVVLKTNDGGQNWSVVLQIVPMVNSIYFVDEMTGWAVGEDYAEANGGNGSTVILSTTDGGNNWQFEDVSDITEGLKDIFFFDRANGWAVGQSGSILKTNDGGETWSPQYSGTKAWLYSVYFINARDGWIAGDYFNYSTSSAVVLTTTDGGRIWSSHPPIEDDLRSIYFVNSLEGWTVGSGVYHTADGGLSWEKVPTIISEYLNSVYFLDDKHGWASGWNGTILKYAPSN